MTITLETIDSPDERDLGAGTVAALGELAREGFSADAEVPEAGVRRHVLDVDDTGRFTLLLARDDDAGDRLVGFGSAYTVDVAGTESICAHGLVVSRDRPYAGKNLGRVLAFGPVLARLRADARDGMPVWGRTQSTGILRFFRSIGAYPRPDEPTPEHLLAFVRGVADYLGDDEVDGHVLRGAYDRQMFSDSDYREWAPRIERLLGGRSFDPWSGDAVLFVAEPTTAEVRRRMETAVDNAEVEIDWAPEQLA